MRRSRRAFAVLVIAVFVALACSGETDAMCGFAGWHAVTILAGGTSWVAVFIPAFPFGMDGIALVGLGAATGPALNDQWMHAVGDVPNNFLSITCPATLICPQPGPPVVCAPPTASIMF